MTFPPDEFDLVDPAGGRRGAHRARSSPVGLVVVLVLLAVGVVAAVLVGLLAAGGDEPVASPGVATDAPVATALPTAAATTGAPEATVTAGEPGLPLGVADRAVPVGVLNATTTGGLAGRVTGELREAGWTVVSAGNYAGADDPPTSVLYAAERLEDTARALAAELGGAEVRLDPAAAGDGLVVVLGEDYTGLD